jgi:hypothetical protein
MTENEEQRSNSPQGGPGIVKRDPVLDLPKGAVIVDNNLVLEPKNQPAVNNQTGQDSKKIA